jgi:uncharacterized protein YcfL
MKRFAMLLACLLLVGCATTGEWTTTDTEQLTKDAILTIGEILLGVFAQ